MSKKSRAYMDGYYSAMIGALKGETVGPMRKNPDNKEFRGGFIDGLKSWRKDPSLVRLAFELFNNEHPSLKNSWKPGEKERNIEKNRGESLLSAKEILKILGAHRHSAEPTVMEEYRIALSSKIDEKIKAAESSRNLEKVAKEMKGWDPGFKNGQITALLIHLNGNLLDPVLKGLPDSNKEFNAGFMSICQSVQKDPSAAARLGDFCTLDPEFEQWAKECLPDWTGTTTKEQLTDWAKKAPKGVAFYAYSYKDKLATSALSSDRMRILDGIKNLLLEEDHKNFVDNMLDKPGYAMHTWESVMKRIPGFYVLDKSDANGPAPEHGKEHSNERGNRK